MTFGRGSWYEQDDRWTEDEKDWDHKRSRTPVADLSEMLRGRKNVNTNGASASKVDAREKIKAKNAAKSNGIKSRLGNVAGAGERKRKLEPAETERRNITAGSKRPARPILDLKQSIVNVLKDNDKKAGRQETFLEKKAKTGEAIVWDSKLSRPRMGMVADMKDSRVSAKNRLHQSGDEAKTEEVIKRIIPNHKPKPPAVTEARSGIFRNVVLTEVVEEEDIPINFKRTVTNDYDVDMEEDGGGFFQDRIVKTRDQFTELKIKQQKTIKQKPSEYDLETDAGNDLPDLGNNRFLIQVRNDSPTPAPVIVQRPKLEAKRSLETKKSKQRREVMLELEEIKDREREVEAKKRREAESRNRKKEEEESRNRRREEIEKKKAETERKRIRELEAKRLEEEKKLEELKRKNEELSLEQQLKKKEDMLKVEEEERKIAELQRQEELMMNKLKLLERQKEVEREKQELDKIRQQKEKDAEASLQKRENEARIKQEIAIIEEQESKIRERQKKLQKQKNEKKKQIQSSDRKSKARRKRRYSSEESSSSESNDSDSDSESSSSDSDSQSSDSDSQDSEHERKEKRKRTATRGKPSSQPSRSSNQKVGRETIKEKEGRKTSASSSSRDNPRHREDRRAEVRQQDRRTEDRYQDRSQEGADRKRSSEVTKESGDLKDKLKSYLNRARAKSRDRDVRN